MAERPEDQQYAPKARISMARRIRAWAIILAFCGVMVAVTIYGVVIGYKGVQPGVAIDKRLEMLLGAAALLFPAWIVAKGYLLRRWQTGRWRRTRAETLASVQQCRVRAGGRTRPIAWHDFVYRRGNYNAFDTTAPRWKRVLGWTTLVLSVLAIVVVAGFGLICIGAAFDESTPAMGAVGILVLAALAFVWPVIMVRAALQRRREVGTLRISREELQEAIDRREAWQESERTKPLGAKITSLFILVCALTYFWMRNVVYHTGHKEPDWITPITYTVFAGYAVWVQFRRPKSDSSAR